MSSNSVHDFLEAMTKAKDAVDAVPGLRRRIDELEAALAQEKRSHDMLAEEHESTEEARRQTEAKLKAVTEERDQYGFRNLELVESLTKVRALVGATVAEAGSVAEPPQGQSATAPLAPDHTSTTSGTTEPTAVSNPVGQSASDPTTTTIQTGSSASGLGSDSGSVSSSSTTTEGQSEAHPTATSSADHASTQSGAPNTTTATATGEQPVNDNRYAGWHYWSKPAGMTWGEFIDRGGNAPSFTYDRAATL
jgi:hypothetical protein